MADISRFFDDNSVITRSFTAIFDYFFLGVLTLIGMIPVVTAGASLTALYYTISRMKEGGADIAKTFFKAYKANLLQGVGLTFVTIIICSIMGGIYLILRHPDVFISEGQKASAAALVAWCIAAVFLFSVIMHFFPLLASYENTLPQIIKNSFLITVLHLPSSLFIALVDALPFLLAYYYRITLPFAVFYGFCFPSFMNHRYYDRIFSVMEGKKSADTEP